MRHPTSTHSLRWSVLLLGGACALIGCKDFGAAYNDYCAATGTCDGGAGDAGRVDAGPSDAGSDGGIACGAGPACGAGQVCDAGSCQCTPASCTGCCQGSRCRQGDQDFACGSAGQQCQDCGGGRCAGGVCSGCSGCAGCCSGPTCYDAGIATCNVNGGACVTCNPQRADSCANGRCSCGANPMCNPGQRCAGGMCICDGASCPSGCCSGSDCKPISTANCGVDGGVCRTCGSNADTCARGACQCGGGPACAPGTTCSGGACCNASNCPGGCCQGLQCTALAFPTCGPAGGACVTCDPQRSDSCGASGCTCGGAAACGNGNRCAGGVCVCDNVSCSDGCCLGLTCNRRSPIHCGFDGGACTTCSGSDSCNSGICQCGTGSACLAGQGCVAGSCLCDDNSCAQGCCQGNLCYTADFTRCGTGGSSCTACSPQRADSCALGGCQCGSGTACAPGQQCTSGSCVCSPSSCAGGCCSGNSCQTPSLANCGANGGACTTCDTRADTCTAGGQCVCGAGGNACVAGQRCVGGACVCDISSCGSGCCDPLNMCHTPSVNFCGIAGTACKACTGAQTCIAGSCG